MGIADVNCFSHFIESLFEIWPVFWCGVFLRPFFETVGWDPTSYPVGGGGKGPCVSVT